MNTPADGRALGAHARLQRMQDRVTGAAVGGFSDCEGLAAALEARRVTTEAQAGDWLLDPLDLGLAPGDLVLLGAATPGLTTSRRASARTRA